MKKLSTIAAAVLTLAFGGGAQAELSYDFLEAGWSYDSLDVPGFDESGGGYIDLSVSIADNAYINLFGSIQDETSSAGFGVGLHHELATDFDLTAEAGGLYWDVVEDFGAYGHFGGRWQVAEFLELNAGVGLEYLESDVEFYGTAGGVIPLYKSLSLAAGVKLLENNQEVRVGLRLDF